MILVDEQTGRLFIFRCPWCKADLFMCQQESCEGHLHHYDAPCQESEGHCLRSRLPSNSLPAMHAYRWYLTLKESTALWEPILMVEWSGEAYRQSKLSVNAHFPT